MINHTNSTPFVKGLVTIGMLLTAGSMTSFAAVTLGTKSFDSLEMQAPASLKVSTPAVAVNGTGTVKFFFSFQIDNGCCMQVKADLMRIPVGKAASIGGVATVGLAIPVASKTFQLCGDQAGNILSATLNANQDDAQFFVQFSNPDTWDKAHLTINHISAIFPTGVISLHTDPNTALTLLQGQDQDRTFNVPDGKVGKVSISLSWTGGAKMKLEVFKPGAATASQTVTSATGSLTVPDINVTASDSGDWKLVYTNISSTNTPANSIATTINMTVVE